MAALDPVEVETSAQLAAALDQLRGTRSLRTLEKAAKESALGLPPSTVSDVLNGKSLPSVDTLIALLRVCGIDDEPTQQAWLQARDRVEHRHQRRPPGAIRVREARARVLGVHAAIQTNPAPRIERGGPGRDESELPPYVPRDLDADLRTQITVAGQRGGFVLLVGGSSVGKTRALFEGVRAVLPNWWLVHPADPDAVRQVAAAPTERTVVWLDELQNYLDHPDGLPAATIRDLITAGTVVLATLWPREYTRRVAAPVDRHLDPYKEDRQLLGLAEVTSVPDIFSEAERRRAEHLATDSRVRVALETPDAGFTQVIAAGPELIRWWENAPPEHCYGQAVITAALDARRVGAHAPLTRAYLETAAPGYLTDRQQATAPPDWLDQALAYATTLLHGATATLTPIPAGMGRIGGYQVADYLHQHALRVRRTTHLTDATWQALVRHHHPDDALVLADNARRRGRSLEAKTLRQHTDNGHPYAASQLASQGGVEELTHQADQGEPAAVLWLPTHLIGLGRIDEALSQLRSLADNGDLDAARQLVDLLVEQGRTDEALTRLRPLADNGDTSAARRLVDLLAKQGCMDDLTHRADNGDTYATRRLAGLLAREGRVDEALTRLRPIADNGDTYAARQLVDLLAKQGHVDELTDRADHGDPKAAYRLAILLVGLGRIDEALTRLRPLADDDDPEAAHLLFSLLVRQGRIDELTLRADNGSSQAAHRLAALLAGLGRIEALTHRADNGDSYAARRLAALSAKEGRIDEALIWLGSLADNGDTFAAQRLAALLVGLGRIDEALTRLRPLADNGDTYAARRLVDVLAKEGRIDELDGEVAAGTAGACDKLGTLQPAPPRNGFALRDSAR